MESKEGIQHALIQKVKEYAIELGRTPTRAECITQFKGFYYQLNQAFGGYTVLLRAAGLDTYDDRRSLVQKIDNSVFNRDLEKHLEDYKPRDQAKAPQAFSRTLFIPDTHFPFAHKPTLEKIYRFAEKEKPEIVVQVGDLRDRYSHGRFPRSHSIFTAEQEDELATQGATEMWAEIKRASPGSRCIQMLGNHDVRPLKQILTQYPQAESWVMEGLKRSMTFDGVETMMDPREELMLPGDVMVTHGHLSKLGDHRDYALYNAVVGHSHLGGVVYRQIRGRVLWELNSGLAGDPESKGLSYTPQKITKWTLGWGWLDAYGPRFISSAY